MLLYLADESFENLAVHVEIRRDYRLAQVLQTVISALTVHGKARILRLSVGYSGLSG